MTNDKDRRAAARFKEILSAYGADPSNWPAEDRALFADRVPEEERLSDDFAEARDLDKLLSQASTPLPDASAVARISENILQQAAPKAADNVVEFAAESHSRTKTSSRLGVPWWPDTALIAASLLIGIVLGQGELMTELGFGYAVTGVPTVEELGNAVLGLNIDQSLISEDIL